MNCAAQFWRLGNFDGVHKGHQQVLNTARAAADTAGMPCGAMVFEPPSTGVF